MGLLIGWCAEHFGPRVGIWVGGLVSLMAARDGARLATAPLGARGSGCGCVRCRGCDVIDRSRPARPCAAAARCGPPRARPCAPVSAPWSGCGHGEQRDCWSASPHDYARLREVAASADLTAPVPSCPDWTVGPTWSAHVGAVYLHKVECMRLGAHPRAVAAGRDVETEEPLALLDRAYADADARSSPARTPESPAFTWYGPDQTVGSGSAEWRRRPSSTASTPSWAPGMAIAPIPDDLALDGIDEFLVAFVEYGTQPARGVRTSWPPPTGGRSGSTRDAAWVIRPTPERCSRTSDDDIAADVTGQPAALLLWLWNRADDGSVTVAGDADLPEYLRSVLAVSAG